MRERKRREKEERERDLLANLHLENEKKKELKLEEKIWNLALFLSLASSDPPRERTEKSRGKRGEGALRHNSEKKLAKNDSEAAFSPSSHQPERKGAPKALAFLTSHGSPPTCILSKAVIAEVPRGEVSAFGARKRPEIVEETFWWAATTSDDDEKREKRHSTFPLSSPCSPVSNASLLPFSLPTTQSRSDTNVAPVAERNRESMVRKGWFRRRAFFCFHREMPPLLFFLSSSLLLPPPSLSLSSASFCSLSPDCDPKIKHGMHARERRER
jgi:hypothetical protein